MTDPQETREVGDDVDDDPELNGEPVRRRGRRGRRSRAVEPLPSDRQETHEEEGDDVDKHIDPEIDPEIDNDPTSEPVRRRGRRGRRSRAVEPLPSDRQETHEEEGDDVDKHIDPEIDPEIDNDPTSEPVRRRGRRGRRSRAVEPLPDGWVSVGPNLVLRIDGMCITTPDASVWSLDLLGNCPFVAETVRYTKFGYRRVQRPLLSNQLAQACQEADERFPVPSWLLETDDGQPQRLDTDNTDNQDNGWLLTSRHVRPSVVVEGIELDEPGREGDGYFVGSGRSWSPEAFWVEKGQAAERRALAKALARRRGR
jgi:hypothetical protein